MSDISYLRGAFITYAPDTYPREDGRRVIPFRFNPESLSRQFQVEQGRSGPGVEGRHPRPRRQGGAQAADAASGAVKQSFSVQVRFDFDDRHESTRGLPAEYGILPERQPRDDKTSNAPLGRAPTRSARRRFA